MSRPPFTLEGALSITAAIEAGRREIHEILMDSSKRRDSGISHLRRRARQADIPLRFVASAAIQAQANGKTHGGVIAIVGEPQYASLAQLLPSHQPAFIVMLDGIEDPYNFGLSVRAIYAAGAHGLVLRPRNWTSASAIVGRASAGATERIPMALVDDPDEAANFFREHNLLIAAIAKSARSVPLYDANLRDAAFILLGGERRGLTRSFLRKADLLLEIPYGRTFAPSLGTVSAVSIVASEALRQRRDN